MKLLKVAIEGETISETEPNLLIFDLGYDACSVLYSDSKEATSTSITFTPTNSDITKPCVFWTWADRGWIDGSWILWGRSYWETSNDTVVMQGLTSGDNGHLIVINQAIDGSGIIGVEADTTRQVNINDNLTSKYPALHVLRYDILTLTELMTTYQTTSIEHGFDFIPAFIAIVEGRFVGGAGGQLGYSIGFANLIISDAIDGTMSMNADVCVDSGSIYFRANASEDFEESLGGIGWTIATAHVWTFASLSP